MSKPYRLTGVGSVLTGGRWNVRNLVPSLYFSTTAATLAAEADAEAMRLGWPPGSLRPQTRVAFNLSLQALVDLTDRSILRHLGMKKTDLTGCDWKAEQTAGREPLTQAIARAAFENGVEALLVPSARRPGGVNVVVFPPHIRPNSTIIAHDESSIPFVHGL